MTSLQFTQDYETLADETSSQTIFNEGKDQILCYIHGYRKSRIRSFFYHLFCMFLAGIPIHEADILLVQDSHENYSITKILTIEIYLQDILISDTVKYFFHQHTRYVWIPETYSFGTLNELLWAQKSCNEYLDDLEGLTDAEYNKMFKLYGPNKIEVEVKSYWKLFLEEIFNPFYLFQAFSIALWYFDDYIVYANCVIVLTTFSSIMSLIQTRKQSEHLHDIVKSTTSYEIQVIRKINNESTFVDINPENLVPGDLIVMPAAELIMPCDAVLLTGQAFVNESVLTGESVPVKKNALHSSSEVYSIDLHKRHTIFSGTHIVQTRYYEGQQVLARVVRTGFDTTKGNLVRSILFPTPVNLQFFKDSFKFILLLFMIAACGMSYCLHLYITRHAKTKETVIRALDIITIVVPPALPAAMAIGTVYSQSRLKKQKIFCISPPRINVCGKIKLACFDKTGTLTHDGLTMNSVIYCQEAQFYEPITDIVHLDDNCKFVQGMATCHSLTRIGGQLNGDPLDLNMFEFSRWKLEEPGDAENTRFDMLGPSVVTPPKSQIRLKLDHGDTDLYSDQESRQIGIIRDFSFSSTLQCMSVICKALETPNLFAFTKGAPEKIFNLCVPSTLPSDFQTKLSYYTAKGYRVIALAYKELHRKFKWKDAQKVQREMIECDLHFLGLLILQNPLKEQTTPVIRQLHYANIRTVMITGDNIMTAISVGRDCGMISCSADVYIFSISENVNDSGIPSIVIEKTGSGYQPDVAVIDVYQSPSSHIAIDGHTWSKLLTYYEHLISSLLVRTTIFARFQPDQKTQAVTALQKLDYIVSMVGDGANDCGALKAAHVGVSLSTTEASVAAPFTSGIPDISCLVRLILEGRCALVTSFATFKYMALYSLIQFISILILYRCYSILGDFQFLYIDLIITTSLTVTMGHQGPSANLCPKRPMSSLISPKTILPLMFQILLCVCFQIGSLYFLYQQSWFKPIKPGNEETTVSWENTVIFTVSCCQYLILAWHFSKTKPYRQSVFNNVWFILNVLSLSIFTTWLMTDPCKKMAELMDLIHFDQSDKILKNFKYVLILFPVGHFVAAGFIEFCMSDRDWLKKFFQCLSCKKQPKNKYKRLLREHDFVQYLNSLPNSEIR
ncbi:polyamine-transporting ATPase 13A3-like isoform X2 [Anthonomus grandis grandis]|uniref:polyamine-transporting ATPase 13A3-like isoform X2 n=1 Tax=Anthonomus grandis grandis TaxID=2921223 RepID=UPI00216525E8|nr:polyamine-transporting ATPase 13A3-like isoform X2 [Anthonomus grandis grandis]